ncbi:MAG: hypothetical protein Q7T80_18375, partial [Methanoregula sp.]|nr:hypothetical protein [Methanoregula sp.]
HELSMKGFMTVRKWIDRSIAGLETRSGDYPIVNTQNVAIIVMLSGLENIPRIDEIRGIREQGKTGYHKPSYENDSISLDSITLSKGPGNAPATSATTPRPRERQPRDERVAFTTKEQPDRDSGARSPVVHQRAPDNQDSIRAGINRAIKKELPVSDYQTSENLPVKASGTQERTSLHHEQRNEPQHRVVARQDHEVPPGYTPPLHHPQPHRAVHHDAPVTGTRVQEPARDRGVPINDSQIRTKDTERQRIEKDLQRQRMIAISGRTLPANTDILRKTVLTPGRTVVHHEPSKVLPPTRVQEQNRPVQPVENPPEQRTVIIGKRKTLPVPDLDTDWVEQDVQEPVEHEELTHSPEPDADVPPAGSDRMKVGVKDRNLRANDDIFGGKSVVRTAVPQARDSGFENSQLAQKKSTPGTGDEREGVLHGGSAPGQSQTPDKKRKITAKKDDFSWIS